MLFTGISESINAQKDSIFWFAAPNVSSQVGQSPIYLRFLTYDQPAQITVEQPANGAFSVINLSIPAYSVDSVDLTAFIASIESPSANAVNTNGLKITSDVLINAFYELRTTSSKEVFSLKGSKGIGTNFYTPFQKNFNVGSTTPSSFSSIEIVATEDNTTVLITPRTAITGHVANSSFSVTLDEGETYSARDTDLNASTSLAGSIVSADNPIAVTVFEGALSSSGCLSPVGDQITSANYCGTDFIVHRGTASSEKVYVLATQNGTTINVTNSSTASTLINWGETYEISLTDTIHYIETSKPVYLIHVAGNGCNLGMAQVPNVFCAGTYNTAFTRSSSDSLGLLLFVRSGFEGMFDINGNTSLISASDFDVVPGTSGEFLVGVFYFSTTDVPVNSYNVVNNSGDVFGLGVFAGQNGLGSSYAYHSEFNSYPFVDAGIDDTICANVSLSLSGIVGGGSVTGYWSSTGFGSFSNVSSDLVNTYIPSPLDSIISPIKLILTSTGPCPVQKDTLQLEVTPAPIVNAGTDQTVCANNALVVLNGLVSGGGTEGKWTTSGTGTFTPNDSTLNATYVPSAADTTNGSLYLVLTSKNSGNCLNEIDSMLVTITGAPEVDAGATSVSVCENNATVSFSGTVSGATTTGKWTTSGNGIFSPNNLSLSGTYQPTSADISAGSIYLYLESTGNGDCTKAKDSILVTFTDAPEVNAGLNLTACTNVGQVDLSGIVSGPTTTGIWSGGTGTFTTSSSDLNAGYIPSASEVSSGSLILTLTSTNNGGCVSESDNVQISFIAPPSANFSYNNVCLGEATDFVDFSLSGFGSIASWDWDFGNGTQSSLPDNTVTFGSAGVYNVSLVVETNVGCSDTLVQSVQVFELPVPDFSYDINCDGSLLTIDFTDQSTVNQDTINYWFYDFGGQGSQAAQNPTQLFVGSGNFVVTQIVSTVHGCVDSVIQIINVPPRPDAGFYYNTSNGLNIGATFEFIDTSSNTTGYAWDFGDGNTSTSQNTQNVYFENGVYTVTQYVVNATGCEDSTTVLISINTITTEINTLIPNAISPNGDGRNDVWKLEFIQLLYPNATVEIYNRWGQQLFYSEGYQYPWNGTFEGERVADGTYFYVINLNDGASEAYRGTLLVLKNNE